MAIFFAAGARITPSLLRVQQGIMTIRMALGQSKPTLDLIDDLVSTTSLNIDNAALDLHHSGFVPEISLSDVSYKYPNKSENAIEDFALRISKGKFIAIVGPSGAGKTTAMDILLGVLKPDSGTVLISGLPSLLAYEKWPGAVSYVPQDTVIINGSIRENVSLGFTLTEVTDELVLSALKIANLDKYVLGLPDGLDTQVGDQGSKLSGGQRQRLGIARAMFTRPHLVVLDESTSSLDVETEASISDSLLALKGSVTVVMIAHRLSAIRSADSVVYMDGGKIMAVGSFEEIRSTIKDFDNQAKLMGL
jgi:ABC-type bacteriocin/lantibiotic exporter with double-glycine peptidase domain